MLIVVVSDEPEVDAPSRRRSHVGCAGRHDVMWAMVSDMPAVGTPDAGRDGYDVATGRFVIGGATLAPRVVAAYRRAEQNRTARTRRSS